MSRQPRRLMRQGVADLPTRFHVDNYLGPDGEIISDGDTLRLHDGFTKGGNPLATATGVRVRGAHIFDYVPPKQHDRIRNGTIDYDMASEVQKGIAETITANCELNLVGGKYPVTNLLCDQDPSYDRPDVVLGVKMPRLIGSPGTVITKLNGGDNRYLFAGKRWAQPVKSSDGSKAYGQGPMLIKSVVFDGAGIAQDVFMNVGYQSTFIDVDVRGGVRDGLVEPVTAIDGTPMTGRSASRYIGLKIYRNGRIGYYVQSSPSCVISDGQMAYPFIWDNGINLKMDQSAGWQIYMAHLWNHGIAPLADATYSARIAGGKALEIVGGDWEGWANQTYGLELEAYDGDIDIGRAVFLEGLGLNARPKSPYYTIAVNNCRFIGAHSRLRHGYSDPQAVLQSSRNFFEVPDGYAFASGAGHSGVLVADRDRMGGGDRRFYTGRQRQGDYACEVPRDGVTFIGSLPYTVGIGDTQTLILPGAALGSDAAITLPEARRGLRYTVVRSAAGSGVVKPMLSDGSASAGAWIGQPSSYNAAWQAVAVTYECDGANWRTLSICQAQT